MLHYIVVQWGQTPLFPHSETGFWNEVGGLKKLQEIVFEDLEIQMNTFVATVTSSTSEADEMFEGMAPMFGLSAEQARTIPMVLAGTVNDVCEQLLNYRDLYGANYWVIHENEFEAMAPVVARMTGT